MKVSSVWWLHLLLAYNTVISEDSDLKNKKEERDVTGEKRHDMKHILPQKGVYKADPMGSKTVTEMSQILQSHNNETTKKYISVCAGSFVFPESDYMTQLEDIWSTVQFEKLSPRLPEVITH